jgi:hypothetical protein
MNNLDTRYGACTITPHQRRCVDRTPNSQMVGDMESIGLFRIARDSPGTRALEASAFSDKKLDGLKGRPTLAGPGVLPSAV